ncbi:hypothetical protein ARMSODRAFT_951636 [Armillaria solidipes]|uniref:Uncharacterized protein n=1 Tax=Armillaria solidipes TaxID=1076256 RepID=A0A2H3BT58_9AGAR|nr:hypothetical protein ARMSODRAFT_951636 [Armillaria solidipes]
MLACASLKRSRHVPSRRTRAGDEQAGIRELDKRTQRSEVRRINELRAQMAFNRSEEAHVRATSGPGNLLGVIWQIAVPLLRPLSIRGPGEWKRRAGKPNQPVLHRSEITAHEYQPVEYEKLDKIFAIRVRRPKIGQEGQDSET